jgi:hypothetical protein
VPHITKNDTRRRSALDRYTTHHCGYIVSLNKYEQIEERLAWMKAVGDLCATLHRKRDVVGTILAFIVTDYNLSEFPRSCSRRNDSV